MYANHDGELRFTTVVLTFLIIVSIIATMTMLGCTDHTDQTASMQEEVEEIKKEELTPSVTQEDDLTAEDGQSADDSGTETDTEETEADTPTGGNTGGNTGGSTASGGGSDDDSGNDSGGDTQSGTKPTCKYCQKTISSYEYPHVVCPVCNESVCPHDDPNDYHQLGSCGHIFCINANNDDGEWEAAHTARGSQQNSSTVIQQSSAPAANSQAEISGPPPCAKCGIAASSAHFTMGCGHVRCANESEHSKHPCGVHYSCGESQADHWSYYPCGHYPCQHDLCPLCWETPCIGDHGDGICTAPAEE